MQGTRDHDELIFRFSSRDSWSNTAMPIAYDLSGTQSFKPSFAHSRNHPIARQSVSQSVNRSAIQSLSHAFIHLTHPVAQSVSQSSIHSVIQFFSQAARQPASQPISNRPLSGAVFSSLPVCVCTLVYSGVDAAMAASSLGGRGAPEAEAHEETNRLAEGQARDGTKHKMPKAKLATERNTTCRRPSS